ncbi:MAG: ATP-binding protein [Bacteroidales bacterium]|nr:ATP-binding protein [Bacteroidales bacterium]
MVKEMLVNIIREGQDIIPEISLYDRPNELEEKGNYVFVGVRQCGKSYMLYQQIQQMLKKGCDIRQIVYVNFDDERLQMMKSEELDLILQAYSSVYEEKPVFFFDEIQNIDGWEHFARRLANQKYQVFITGSNAKMLGRDIATTLGGRYWTKDVYPFTFKEFLESRDVKLDKVWYNSQKKRAVVERAFNEYFYFGGFPEIRNVVAKRLWLNELYNKIFFADLVVRNKIRNEAALRLTMRRLAECVGQPTAYNRISNMVKSAGVNCQPNTVMDFVRFMRDACMVFSLTNYIAKFSERETIKKHYFVDNGLLNIFLNNNDSVLLENLCAIHLRQNYSDEQLYYYNKNVEVDFYLPEEKTAIQVCYSLSDIKTVEREINAMVKLHDFEPLRRALIITRDEEKTIQHNSGLTIEVVPVWKWLLEYPD